MNPSLVEAEMEASETPAAQQEGTKEVLVKTPQIGGSVTNQAKEIAESSPKVKSKEMEVKTTHTHTPGTASGSSGLSSLPPRSSNPQTRSSPLSSRSSLDMSSIYLRSKNSLHLSRRPRQRKC